MEAHQIDARVSQENVLPLFIFDRLNASRRPKGLGTTFRVDRLGGCATAFHNLEPVLRVEQGQPEPHLAHKLAALELGHFVVFGQAMIPEESWRAVNYVEYSCDLEQKPLQLPRIKNTTELAYLHVPTSSTLPMRPLPLDLWGRGPAVGDVVTAYGYADLDKDDEELGEDRVLEKSHLHDYPATITEIVPNGQINSRPWPHFRVDAHWPGGMSGGPVINKDGRVVGIVSMGDGETSSAARLAGFDVAAYMFRRAVPASLRLSRRRDDRREQRER